MALPVGPVNNKAAIILTSAYQQASFQPFIGSGSKPQGWHHFADDKPGNTICFFLISSGSAAPIRNATGEVFFSKQPTTIRAYYDRGPTYYTVSVNTFSAELGIYYAYTNGTNAGAINPDTQIGIGAWNTLTAQQVQMMADVIKEYSPSGTPYEGDPSGPGGGLGPHEMHYDSIAFPDLPETSAVNTGFASVWVPELPEVQALATYMWNCDPTTLDWWKKLKADPLDLILGFYIFPVELTPDGSESVTIGLINTGVEMHYRNSQYVDVDCGTIQLDEYWKAYLDYSPYTRLSIFLPYIGVRPLNIDDVMTRAITLKYRIDLVSGACVAMIRVDSGTDEQDREAVLYQFTGICSTQIPITSTQMGDIFRSAVSLGVATVAAVASEGASVAIAGAASAAANLASTKPDIAHSGAIGSAAGLMGVQRPYLIIERPRQAVPEEQQHYTGFPSFITEDLSELEGYTEVEAVHLHGLGCTENEAQEIERLLLEGVIF